MKFTAKDIAISARYRISFQIAVIGLLCGFLFAHLQSRLLEMNAQRNVAAAIEIRAVDELLANWRQNYLGTELQPAIAAIALSPERGWQVLEARKSLLASFEKKLPVGERERLFLSDKTMILIEAGGSRP